MTYPNKEYLGDGAYVEQGSFMGEIVLTTSDGMRVTNSVTLGPDEWAVLTSWYATVHETEPR